MRAAHILSTCILGAVVGCRPTVTSTAADTTQQISCTLIGVTVSPASISMLVGDVVILLAIQPPPCGGTPKPAGVRWRSSDTSVASVDSLDGTVHGLAVGQATIIASDVNDPNVNGAAAVQVNAR